MRIKALSGCLSIPSSCRGPDGSCPNLRMGETALETISQSWIREWQVHPPTEIRDGQQGDHEQSMEEQQGDAGSPVGVHERGSGDGAASTKKKEQF